jgi:hypothetical protein
LIETQHGEEAASFLIDINGYFEEKMEVCGKTRACLPNARGFLNTMSR